MSEIKQSLLLTLPGGPNTRPGSLPTIAECAVLCELFVLQRDFSIYIYRLHTALTSSASDGAHQATV